MRGRVALFFEFAATGHSGLERNHVALHFSFFSLLELCGVRGVAGHYVAPTGCVLQSEMEPFS